MQVIAELLRQRIGFDAKILGDRKLARAIEARRAACRLPDTQSYLQTLQSSAQEFDEFVEQIVVPETWFFRDRKPFDFLFNVAQSSKQTHLRILSAPCSTGEEPYSIAIALLEAGLSVQQFSIDAIDISQQALTKAQRAIYGKNSFRGEDWVDRTASAEISKKSSYFQSVGDKYTVNPTVRAAVNFRQANVLTEWSHAQPKYDIIFCRNLLIYLEDTACQQVLDTLHSLLVTDGLLFVGAAETGKVRSSSYGVATGANRFLYLRESFTFAYRKINSLSTYSDPIPIRDFATTPVIKTLTTPSIRSSAQPVKEVIVRSVVSELQQAKQLADTGQIAAAIECCTTYLASHITDAEAYELLGTLYQATKHAEQAERCFQKALYLQPNLSHALMQLALLKESRGDAIGAGRLRQRIQKLHPTHPSDKSF